MALVFVVMHLYNNFFLLLLFIPTFFLKSGIDKSMEWSMIPACPSLTCFFNRGDTEGTYSQKILCSMSVCGFCLCKFVSGLILWFWDNLWFGDLRAE